MELACIERLRGGTTTFADMYFCGNSLATACKAVGLRAWIGEAIFNFPSKGAQHADEYLSKTEKFLSIGVMMI